jgi:hypothetical protein
MTGMTQMDGDADVGRIEPSMGCGLRGTTVCGEVDQAEFAPLFPPT